MWKFSFLEENSRRFISVRDEKSPERILKNAADAV
jgi:hypothetical protein